MCPGQMLPKLRNYYSLFTDEETEAQSTKITQSVTGETQFQPKQTDFIGLPVTVMLSGLPSQRRNGNWIRLQMYLGPPY